MKILIQTIFINKLLLLITIFYVFLMKYEFFLYMLFFSDFCWFYIRPESDPDSGSISAFAEVQNTTVSGSCLFKADSSGTGAVSDILDPGGERWGGGPQERDQQSDDQDGGPIPEQQGEIVFITLLNSTAAFWLLQTRDL